MGSLSGNHQFLGQSMAEAQMLEVATGTLAVYSTPAPEQECANEDAAAIFETAGACVMVLADGAGGYNAGAAASQAVIEAMVQTLSRQVTPDVRAAVLDGFELGQQRVMALGVGAATTLAVAVVQDGHLRTYHTGDSGICVTGGMGKRKLLTVFHSPTGYAVESGVLDENEALAHEDRHLVSNLIGTSQMSVEMGSPLRLGERDTVLLASDGLFDNLLVDEIIETIRKGPLDTVAQALAARARTRMVEPEADRPGKPDDITFILYRRRDRKRTSRPAAARN